MRVPRVEEPHAVRIEVAISLDEVFEAYLFNIKVCNTSSGFPFKLESNDWLWRVSYKTILFNKRSMEKKKSNELEKGER